MQVYDDTLAPDRPRRGYEGHTARRLRLEYEALSVVFNNWEVRSP